MNLNWANHCLAARTPTSFPLNFSMLSKGTKFRIVEFNFFFPFFRWCSFEEEEEGDDGDPFELVLESENDELDELEG